MDNYNELLGEMEIHSPEAISAYFQQGGNPNEIHNGTPLFTSMVEMYLRSNRFASCVRVFIAHGLTYPEPGLLAVLANDPVTLSAVLDETPGLLSKTFHLHNNAFSPLAGATLLHYCAEYGHAECARLLLDRGAAVDAPAGLDENGFGGQNALFHAVCQHEDHSAAVRKLLLTFGADPLKTVKGMIWGKGYEWETFVPTVNSLGYAMMGLLRQFQRKEDDIYKTVAELMQSAYGSSYHSPNIPNRYLSH